MGRREDSMCSSSPHDEEYVRGDSKKGGGSHKRRSYGSLQTLSEEYGVSRRKRRREISGSSSPSRSSSPRPPRARRTGRWHGERRQSPLASLSSSSTSSSSSSSLEDSDTSHGDSHLAPDDGQGHVARAGERTSSRPCLVEPRRHADLDDGSACPLYTSRGQEDGGNDDRRRQGDKLAESEVLPADGGPVHDGAIGMGMEVRECATKAQGGEEERKEDGCLHFAHGSPQLSPRRRFLASPSPKVSAHFSPTPSVSLSPHVQRSHSSETSSSPSSIHIPVWQSKPPRATPDARRGQRSPHPSPISPHRRRHRSSTTRSASSGRGSLGRGRSGTSHIKGESPCNPTPTPPPPSSPPPPLPPPPPPSPPPPSAPPPSSSPSLPSPPSSAPGLSPPSSPTPICSAPPEPGGDPREHGAGGVGHCELVQDTLSPLSSPESSGIDKQSDQRGGAQCHTDAPAVSREELERGNKAGQAKGKEVGQRDERGEGVVTDSCRVLTRSDAAVQDDRKEKRKARPRGDEGRAVEEDVDDHTDDDKERVKRVRRYDRKNVVGPREEGEIADEDDEEEEKEAGAPCTRRHMEGKGKNSGEMKSGSEAKRERKADSGQHDDDGGGGGKGCHWDESERREQGIGARRDEEEAGTRAQERRQQEWENDSGGKNEENGERRRDPAGRARREVERRLGSDVAAGDWREGRLRERGKNAGSRDKENGEKRMGEKAQGEEMGKHWESGMAAGLEERRRHREGHDKGGDRRTGKWRESRSAVAERDERRARHRGDDHLSLRHRKARDGGRQPGNRGRANEEDGGDDDDNDENRKMPRDRDRGDRVRMDNKTGPTKGDDELKGGGSKRSQDRAAKAENGGGNREPPSRHRNPDRMCNDGDGVEGRGREAGGTEYRHRDRKICKGEERERGDEEREKRSRRRERERASRRRREELGSRYDIDCDGGGRLERGGGENEEGGGCEDSKKGVIKAERGGERESDREREGRDHGSRKENGSRGGGDREREREEEGSKRQARRGGFEKRGNTDSSNRDKGEAEAGSRRGLRDARRRERGQQDRAGEGRINYSEEREEEARHGDGTEKKRQGGEDHSAGGSWAGAVDLKGSRRAIEGMDKRGSMETDSEEDWQERSRRRGSRRKRGRAESPVSERGTPEGKRRAFREDERAGRGEREGGRKKSGAVAAGATTAAAAAAAEERAGGNGESAKDSGSRGIRSGGEAVGGGGDKVATGLGKTGGVYIPPFKLAQMMKSVTDKTSEEYQRMTWDALRKSINGLVNKVNTSNVKNIVRELFAENLIRGRGVFARSILKSQMASPVFTPVYTAVVAVVNTKFQGLGELVLKRTILQFKRAFRRNDKPVCVAVTKFIAHLVNQQVAHEILALELLTLLLDQPTDDSVEVAVGFIKECGAILSDVAPTALHYVFERFRAVLHEGEIDKRVQFMIEGLFAIRKANFSGFPAVVPELDLVDTEDQVVHKLSLDDPLDPETGLDIFKPDPEYAEHEKKYEELKREILGDDDDEEDEDDGVESDDDEDDEEDENDDDDQSDQEAGGMQIEDQTDTNLVNLRRTIYLTIMSSVDFEEAGHKLLKIKLAPGQEMELCTMLLECCSQERTYLRYYGLLGQRFCNLDKRYQELFDECFMKQYAMIHRLETNKLRNVAKFFAHLLGTEALTWHVLAYIRLTEEDTTSSSRIFIKILFQELSEHLGLRRLNERLCEPAMQGSFEGIFPKDNPKNTRFAINFFTSIGLGGLTDGLREYLKSMPKLIMQQQKPILENGAFGEEEEEEGGEGRKRRVGSEGREEEESMTRSSSMTTSSSSTTTTSSRSLTSSTSGTSSGSDCESSGRGGSSSDDSDSADGRRSEEKRRRNRRSRKTSKSRSSKKTR